MPDLSAKDFGTTAISFIIIALVLNQFFGVVGIVGTDAGVGQTGIVDGSGEVSIPLQASIENHTNTQTTLGDGLSLDGSSSAQVSVDADTQVGGSEFGVATWASVRDPNQTQSVVGFETLAISYNGSTNEYRGYYYNESSRQSYAVTGAATDPANPTLLIVQKDGDQLQLYEDDVLIGSTTIDSSGSADAPTGTNLNGTVEETRVFDYALNSSQRTEWTNEPVLAVDGPAPAMRITYDTRDGSSTPLFFASGSVSLGSGTSFVDGFSGPAITAGTDYEWGGTDNNVVGINDGSQLEQNGAVVWTSYDVDNFGGLINSLEGATSGAMAILVLSLLVIAAGNLFDIYEF